MAIMGENTGLSRLANAGFSLTALLFAAACGGEGANPDEPAPDETASPARSDEAKHATPAVSRSPVPEAGGDRSEADAAGDYRLAWAFDAARCETVVGALQGAAGATVQWITANEDVSTATFNYFNDGLARAVERRSGILAGNRIVTLWVDDGAGGFLRLDFGHAGANTEGLPAIDNLHTKLTYSTADVLDLKGNFVTLVTPLRDVDAAGDIYVIKWKVKTDRAAPFGPRDYYPYVECLITPVKGER